MGRYELVGPRPIVTQEIERYGENIKEYYMVPPGITGIWQVNGRSDTTYEERVAMDTWYVRNWSIWIDLVYLFKIREDGIYRKRCILGGKVLPLGRFRIETADYHSDLPP